MLLYNRHVSPVANGIDPSNEGAIVSAKLCNNTNAVTFVSKSPEAGLHQAESLMAWPWKAGQC